MYNKNSSSDLRIFNTTVLVAVFFLTSVLLTACQSSKTISNAILKDKQPFTFFVLGDWGYKGQHYQIPVATAMINQSRKQSPELILTVGDNFYETGVESIADEHWQLSFENIYKELTRKYSWYGSLGNHDYGANPEAQIEYHAVNNNWNMPARYYTFTKKTSDSQNVRFIVLDTNPYITSYYTDKRYKLVMPLQDTAKQTHWVDSVLASSKEEWKIVYGHHPLYAANASALETETLIRVMKPMFEKYNVQAYISGHDHIMQYNRLENSKVAYIISGSGAKPVNKAPKNDFTLFSSNAPGFASCSIKGNQLLFNFIDTSGNIMYHNTIFK